MKKIQPVAKGSMGLGAAISRLSPDSPEPLYRQLAEVLRVRIDAGEFPAGHRLESEPEMMARFSVSRVTVRQAISLLEKHGKVMARRGKGTFVVGPVVQHDLNALQGFYDALRDKGIEPQTRLLEFSPAGGALDERPPHAANLPVRLKRLYAIDDQPFALVTGYLPKAAGSLGEQRAERLTVYQILEHYMGMRIGRAEVTIRCQKPPKDVARVLGMKSSEQALVMERCSYSQADEACEYMRIFIVPERFEFRLRVTGALEIARSVHLVPTADPAQ